MQARNAPSAAAAVRASPTQQAAHQVGRARLRVLARLVLVHVTLLVGRGVVRVPAACGATAAAMLAVLAALAGIAVGRGRVVAAGCHSCGAGAGSLHCVQACGHCAGQLAASHHLACELDEVVRHVELLHRRNGSHGNRQRGRGAHGVRAGGCSGGGGAGAGRCGRLGVLGAVHGQVNERLQLLTVRVGNGLCRVVEGKAATRRS